MSTKVLPGAQRKEQSKQNDNLTKSHRKKEAGGSEAFIVHLSRASPGHKPAATSSSSGGIGEGEVATPHAPSPPLKTHRTSRKVIVKKEGRHKGKEQRRFREARATVLVTKQATGQQGDGFPLASALHQKKDPERDAPTNIASHKLIGCVEEYHETEWKRNNSTTSQIDRSVSKAATDVNNPTKEVTGSQQKQRTAKSWTHSSRNTRALLNWKSHMRQRHRQLGIIASTIGSSADQLIMNKSEHHRLIVEEKELISRAIPSMDCGNGYRTGSEFWKQSEHIGDDDTGIHTTLTLSQRGKGPELMQIGKPLSMQKELGIQTQKEMENSSRWKKTEYLEVRKQQLEPSLSAIKPFPANIDQLEIKGKTFIKSCQFNRHNDKTKCDVDDRSKSSSIFNKDQLDAAEGTLSVSGVEQLHKMSIGPKAIVNGHTINRDDDMIANMSGTEDVIIRVTMSSNNDELVSSCMIVTNTGSTALQIDLQKLQQVSSLRKSQKKAIQRFYYYTTEKSVLPGETASIPISFRSMTAGIFTETLQISTQPGIRVHGRILLVIKGIATKEDHTVQAREDLQRRLSIAQRDQIIASMINKVLSNVKETKRPNSPIESRLTEKDLFQIKNPTLKYDANCVAAIKLLAANHTSAWDLSIDSLYSLSVSIEDEEEREQYLKDLNDSLKGLLSPKTEASIGSSLHNAFYKQLALLCDCFHERAMWLCHLNGLPQKTFAVATQSEDTLKKGKRSSELQKGADRNSDSRRDKRDTSQSFLKSKHGSKGDQPPDSGTSPAEGTSDQVNSTVMISDKLHLHMYTLMSECITNALSTYQQ